MTVISQSDFKLAVGWNNVAGFIAIPGYTPTSADESIAYVEAFKNYVPGLAQPRLGNLPDYIKGFKKTAWGFPAGFWDWHDWYMVNTFCGGGRSGLVTVRTLTDHPTTFSNFNALMRLPDRDSLSFTNSSFDTYQITFSLRGAAS